MPMKDYLGEIAAAVVAFVLLSILASGFNHWINIATDAFFEIFVAILAIILVVLFLVSKLHREIKLLLDHYKQLDELVRVPILLFLRPQLRTFLEVGRSIVPKIEASENALGIEVDATTLNNLVGSCFSSNAGSYQGTDSNKPSDFNRLYPRYVWLEGERKQKDRSFDTRYLLVNAAELKADFAAHKTQFIDFVDSHLHKGILLLQCERESAINEASRLHLPSPDIGVFGWRFVVFFSPPTTSGNMFRVSIFPLRDSLRQRVKEYLTELNKAATRIAISGDNLTFESRKTEDISRQSHRMLSGS